MKTFSPAVVSAMSLSMLMSMNMLVAGDRPTGRFADYPAMPCAMKILPVGVVCSQGLQKCTTLSKDQAIVRGALIATAGEVCLLKGLDVIEHGLAQGLTKDAYPHPGEVVCKFFLNLLCTAGGEFILETCGITSPDKKPETPKKPGLVSFDPKKVLQAASCNKAS